MMRHYMLCPCHTDNSICCNSCGVPEHKNMSSAKQRLLRYSASIFMPMFYQFNLLDNIILSSDAVNSLGEMVSACLTPLYPNVLNLSVHLYC